MTEAPPYVISADVNGLLTRWTKKQSLNAPDKGYFKEMQQELACQLGGCFDPDQVKVVEQEDIERGMQEMVRKSPCPVVSLDRAYELPADRVVGYLDVTRAVDPNFNDLGLRPRPGAPSIDMQLQAIRNTGHKRIALVDDVIFGGGGMVDVIQKLAKQGQTVEKVYTGIGIEEGVARVEATGVPVECYLRYENVTDEICERDFTAGVPMSGRTVIEPDGRSYSAPYFKPLGDPGKWASIPEDTSVGFSRFCLAQSARLWGEIEKLSGRTVTGNEVPRKFKGANGESVTATLKKCEKQLEWNGK